MSTPSSSRQTATAGPDGQPVRVDRDRPQVGAAGVAGLLQQAPRLVRVRVLFGPVDRPRATAPAGRGWWRRWPPGPTASSTRRARSRASANARRTRASSNGGSGGVEAEVLDAQRGCLVEERPERLVVANPRRVAGEHVDQVDLVGGEGLRSARLDLGHPHDLADGWRTGHVLRVGGEDQVRRRPSAPRRTARTPRTARPSASRARHRRAAGRRTRWAWPPGPGSGWPDARGGRPRSARRASRSRPHPSSRSPPARRPPPR